MLGTVLRHGSRRLRVGAALVVVGLAVAGGAALRDRDDPAPPPPAAEVPPPVAGAAVPLRAGLAPGPGAPLRDGLVVPEGAALLGTPVPLRPSLAEGEVGDRWEAVLVVTGAPSAVVAAVVAQAEGRGATARATCAVLLPAAGYDEEERCSGWARWPDGRRLELELSRRTGRRAHPAVPPLAPQSHLLLAWTGPGDDRAVAPDLPGPGPGAELPVPTGWAPLAGPGDPLRGPLPGLRAEGERLPLPAGVAEVGPLTTVAVDVVRSTLVVTGDVDAALAALSARIVAAYSVTGDAAAEPVTVHDLGAVEVRRQVVRYDLSAYVLTAVGRPGHPTYLVVDQHPLD